MIEQMASPLQRVLLVFDDQNRLVVSGQTWRTTESSDPTEQILGVITATKNLPDHIELNGESFILTSTQSSSNAWKYVAVSSIQDLSQKSKNVQFIAWGLAGLIALIWGAAAVIGSNKLYSPLQRLVNKFSVKDELDIVPYSQDSDIIANLDLTMQNLKEKNDHLMVRLNSQMPIMKEHILLNIIHGKLTDPEMPAQAWQSELATLKATDYYVGIIEIDQWLELKQTYSETDRSLMMYALRKWIEELGEAYFPLLGVSPKHGQLVFIIGVDEAGHESEDRIRQFGHKLCNQMDRVFPFTLSVAIAGPRAGHDQIHVSYDEAQSLLAYRLAMGPSALIMHETIGNSMNASIRRLIVHEHDIVSSIAQGQYDQANSNLNKLVQEASQSLHSSEAILGLFTHLLGELDHFLQTSDVELSVVVGGDAMKPISEMSSLSQLHLWMRDTVLKAIQEHLESIQVPRRKKTIQQAVAILRDQLESDISLQLLASQLQISRATLSKWFKEETGDNFGDYLIQARMEKAKEWLSTSDMSIKMIAERLRYTSVTNFTRIFKQSTGATPGAYRNVFRASDE
jgi:AraC-like DNA-binding protein